jgi:hypothetical protein
MLNTLPFGAADVVLLVEHMLQKGEPGWEGQIELLLQEDEGLNLDEFLFRVSVVSEF